MDVWLPDSRYWILDTGYWILDTGYSILDTGISIFDSRYSMIISNHLENSNMSYKQLEIWQLFREVVIAIHRMTLEELPKFEMYEEGSQIRRSPKSVKSNIVEGYGRRNYKQDFIKYLYYVLGSNDETLDHLETLFETGSLADEKTFCELKEKLDKLGKKLNNFIKTIEKSHNNFS